MRLSSWGATFTAVAAGAAAIVLVQASTGAAGGDPAAACAVAKRKAAGAALSAALKCHATAAKRAEPVEQDCLADAASKLTDAFTKAEGKGACLSTGDVDEIGAILDGTLAGLLAALPASGVTTTTLPPVDCDVGSCEQCQLCVQGGACEAQITACDSSCVELANCINQCILNGQGDPCAQECLASIPDGVAAYNAYVTCVVNNCPTTCS